MVRKRKIGIDAKWLYQGPISGKVVLESYLKYLSRYINDQLQIYLILDRRDDLSEERYKSQKFKFIYVWGKINLISNILLTFPLRKHQLDIVLYFNFGPFFSKINYILFLHDVLFDDFPEYFSIKERLYFKFIKPSSRKAKRIITISESEKDRLVNHNYKNASKIDVVYNGVDTHRFKENRNNGIVKLRQEFDITSDYLIYYGRLNDRKNIHSLVKATKKIFKKENVLLVIVGAEDSLFTQSIKNEPHIRLTGFIDDSDLAVLLRNSLAFCYVSFAEGFGLPPLEAMSIGVPTVVSNTTSLPEVCGNASIYVDPYKVEDITKGINDILDPAQRIECISLGYKNAKRFSWNSSASKLLNILKE